MSQATTNVHLACQQEIRQLKKMNQNLLEALKNLLSLSIIFYLEALTAERAVYERLKAKFEPPNREVQS